MKTLIKHLRQIGISVVRLTVMPHGLIFWVRNTKQANELANLLKVSGQYTNIRMQPYLSRITLFADVIA